MKIIVLFSLFFISVVVKGARVPQWQNLNCEEGHKYLFSDVTHTWEDALAECQLYGGWLLSLDSLEEQNCLLRYDNISPVPTAWYWTDGLNL